MELVQKKKHHTKIQSEENILHLAFMYTHMPAHADISAPFPTFPTHTINVPYT